MQAGNLLPGTCWARADELVLSKLEVDREKKEGRSQTYRAYYPAGGNRLGSGQHVGYEWQLQ